ncbi:MAG: hypothetical protein ABI681_05780 [Gemmatimonadales bacterium]
MRHHAMMLVALLSVVTLSACSGNATPGDTTPDSPAPSGNAGTTPSQQSDWNAIQRIEAEAKAIAKVDGCASSADCRSAPVGSRACGGPRYYIPWCSKTTDSAALYRKLDEVAKAEEDYNRKHNLASTCEFRMPPTVQSSGGSCVAQ